MGLAGEAPCDFDKQHTISEFFSIAKYITRLTLGNCMLESDWSLDERSVWWLAHKMTLSTLVELMDMPEEDIDWEYWNGRVCPDYAWEREDGERPSGMLEHYSGEDMHAHALVLKGFRR